jgi:hypothetical protein
MRTRTLTIAVGLAVASLAACGSDRLLVGSGPGGAGGTASPAGGAGTASAGTTGAGGAIGPGTGGATTAGAAGTASLGSAGIGGGTLTGVAGAGAAGSPSAPTPLPISALAATARIASVLWQQPQVDGAILALVQSGQIKTVEDLAGVVRQMLADSRARAGIGAFYSWWLGLDLIPKITKDPTLFPAYTPELQADIVSETEGFGNYVTLDLKGTYGMLMTAPFSLLDSRLADLYGVPGVTSTDLTEVALDPSQRGGILTQAAPLVRSSLSNRNDPSLRGAYIFERLLCHPFPGPPANIPPLDPQITPGVTVRKALAESVANAVCEACHLTLDPPGLEFETYDAIGRWRTTDNGAPVDVSGLSVLDYDSNAEVSIAGPIAYASFLAGTATARSCFAQQWLAFALRQTDATGVMPQQVTPIFQKFTDSGFDLQELIVDVLTSDTFLAPS